MIRLGPWLLLSCCTGRPWNFPMIPQERVGGGGGGVCLFLSDSEMHCSDLPLTHRSKGLWLIELVWKPHGAPGTIFS